MLPVLASNHQCHPKYFGQGRQCVANSYAAMVHHSTMKKASKWTQKDMDEILLEGDNMYYNIKMGGLKENHLLIADLPDQWKNCELKVVKCDVGSIPSVNPSKPYVTLNQAVRETEKFLFLTIKCYTMAIIKEDDIYYYVFDPHARNRDGMVDADGKAVLTLHTGIENLIIFLEKFASSLGDTKREALQFEATHINIVNKIDAVESDDFDGFSDISDGEYSCLMQIIEEGKDEKMKKMEEEVEQTSPDDFNNSFDDNNPQTPSSSNKSSSELSEDDIPLASLSKLLKVDSHGSDSEYNSSGSEYQLSDYEKKMLNDSFSENSSSDSDSCKKKRIVKRKSKKNRKVSSTKRSSTDKLEPVRGIEHSYFSKENRTNCDKFNEDKVLVSNIVETEHKCIDNEDSMMEESIENAEQEYQIDRGIAVGVVEELKSNLQCNDSKFENGLSVVLDQDMEVAQEVVIKVIEEGESVDEGEYRNTQGVDTDGERVQAVDVGSTGESSIGIYSMQLGQDLEVAQEVIIAGLVEDESVQKDEGRNNEGVETAGDTVQVECVGSVGESSMEELIEDLSFDRCVTYIGNESKIAQVRGRKRTRNIDNWRRNKAKRNHNSGERYTDSRGNSRRGKKMGKGCGLNCRFKCHCAFTEEDRKAIFHSFWKLGEVTRQRQFLLKYAAPQQKKSKKQSSNRKRENSFMWSLPLNGTIVRVCKTFFTHTLDINAQRVQTALRKSQNIMGIVDLDQRGKHSNRPNRTLQDKIAFVVSHIKSFPAVESHYCRKDSNKLYLSPDLSVAEMYRLYLEKCAKENVSPVSLNLYRHIFNTRFNIAFQRPLKDQCDLCNAYKNATEGDKIKMKENYDNHIKNKMLARESKEQNKLFVQENIDGTFVAACFDLEEVLMTPKAFESCLYYKRRLNTFNFSIYDLGSGDAQCYVWNESISGRGSCEISSNVFDYLDEMSKRGKKEFVFYSDNCWAQNKNRQYVSMLWFAIQKLNLESVEHNYLEKGHTQNENDSVHASVERHSRKMCVYTTAQWAAVIRGACRKKPYIVKELDLANFYDFKSVKDTLKNFQIDLDRNPICWPNVRSFKIEARRPNIVAIKYDYDGPVHYLDLANKFRRSNNVPNAQEIVLHRLHKDYPKISFEKYKDLLSLCSSGVIPHAHHLFYAVLSHELPNA